MSTRRMSRRLPVLAVLCAAMLTACERATAPVVQRGTAELHLQASAMPASVTTIVVTVTAADIPAPGLIYNLVASNGTASGTLTIPAGSNRHVAVAGFDANGVRTYQGSTDLPTVQAGNDQSVTITLTPLAGSQPITITLQTFTVAVTPTSLSLVAGGAPQTLSVQVTAADNSVITNKPGDVQWATDNPGVATVDANGVVTAVGTGTATIMATYNGIGAAAAVTVQ